MRGATDEELLFVYGDRPESGRRSDDLTVRGMIDEARRFHADRRLGTGRLRLGVTTRLGALPLPAWKRAADFVFVQVSFDLERLLAWRDSLEFDGPVFAA